MSDDTSNPTETDSPSETPQISPAQAAAYAEYCMLARQIDEYFQTEVERIQKLKILCHSLLGHIFQN